MTHFVSELVHPLLAASLLLLLGLAVSGDLRAHRIPNWLSLGGVAIGLVLQFATGGRAGLAEGLYGALAGGLALLPMWLLRGLAAGDVKLMAAVGAHLGAGAALVAVLATLIAGGVMGLAVLLRRRGAPRPAAADRLDGALSNSFSNGFAYAPAIAAGTLLALLLPLLRPALAN
ncbi:MAG: prepilin peptidase [Sinimarinibacterium sp.]